jgi:DNA-binding transcriptional MocR family regulator
MRRISSWVPDIPQGPGRLYERLTAGIADAILTGQIAAGTALPAHRTLAAELGTSVGTVTRAYDLLQRRGLARAEKGRGMFVAALAQTPATGYDLSVNLPPAILTTTMLSTLMSRVASTIDADQFNRYAPPAGRPEHRAMLAQTLNEGRMATLDPANLIMTNGAQHGIFIALASLPDRPLAIEALGYPGALRAARTMGRTLVPLAMDGEGVTPAALRSTLAAANPPRAVYLMPSLQNPTGATMGLARRAEIVAIAREHDITLIEDDVYSVFAPPELPRLVDLAPERVMYIGSLSKSLAIGLRVGYLVVPPDRIDSCTAWMQATQSMTNPVSALLMAQALGDGVTKSVAQSVRAEAQRRTAIARGILGKYMAPQPHDGLHVWLPMTTALARDVVLAAARHSITLAPPEAFMADPDARQTGLRLCLGAVSEHDLRKALAVIARLLSPEGDVAQSLQPVA